jgi:hypothetical protein
MAAMTETKNGKNYPFVLVHAFPFGNQGGMKLTFPLSPEFSQFILHEIELPRW